MKKILPPLAISLISLYFLIQSLHEPYTSILSSVNLIFHESGHAIIFFLGSFMQILGGSIMQILVPTILVAYFFVKQKPYETSLLSLWVADNFFNVSTYAGDAIKLQLPLLGDLGPESHDWFNILNSLNLLKYTQFIANTIHFIGIIIILLAVFYSWKTYLATKKDPN
jgi:hypothetical protein